MLVCFNQIQTNKSLSLVPYGPITTPVSLLFITKLPQSVVSIWCLKQTEQSIYQLKQRLTENIQTKAEIIVEYMESIEDSNMHIIEIPERERK